MNTKQANNLVLSIGIILIVLGFMILLFAGCLALTKPQKLPPLLRPSGSVTATIHEY